MIYDSRHSLSRNLVVTMQRFAISYVACDSWFQSSGYNESDVVNRQRPYLARRDETHDGTHDAARQRNECSQALTGLTNLDHYISIVNAVPIGAAVGARQTGLKSGFEFSISHQN